MKLTKRIWIALCGLLIQWVSPTKAAEPEAVQCYPKIFNQEDVVGCIVKNFGEETPFSDFWNLCSTNKEIFNKYSNKLKQIAYQSKCFNIDFLFEHQNSFLSCKVPQRYIACLEKGLSELKGISSEMDVGDSCITQFETSLDASTIFDLLINIRTVEKEFNPATPLDPLSPFSLDVRELLWEAEGASMVCFDATSLGAEPEIRMNQAAMVKKYLNIVFQSHERGLHFNKLNARDILNLYWFTMLTRDFFQCHPFISLMYSLTAKSRYEFHLIDSKSKEKIYKCEYSELVCNIFYNDSFLINKEYIVSEENLYLNRRKCLEFALKEIPEAWALYQKALINEPNGLNFEGLENPNLTAQPH